VKNVCWNQKAPLQCSELSHRGLHGSFMNVGVISDVGFAAEQNLVREWQARGIKAVSSADVCLAMGQMLARNLPSLGLSRKVDTMAYFQAISESFALSCLANRHLKIAKSDNSTRVDLWFARC